VAENIEREPNANARRVFAHPGELKDFKPPGSERETNSQETIVTRGLNSDSASSGKTLTPISVFCTRLPRSLWLKDELVLVHESANWHLGVLPSGAGCLDLG
jgi:hypothetical protein